ncbi:MAG TPA: MutS2/Smr-associated SH3 domain-containing protein, partial [Niabella sp.]|nr:MutS2/Smr-associated SH3 domain-containing protein [Niabella sp.]
GLEKRLIEKARGLVEEDQYRLDKLLNRTEQDLRDIAKKDKELERLIRENERLQKEMQQVMDKERHKQQVAVLREQNKISEDRITYLKDMERKLKQITIEWKKEEDKQKLIKQMAALLFNRPESKKASKMQKKLESKYSEVGGDIKVGDKVKMRRNHQVGEVLEIKGKRAVVKIGLLPMQVELSDLIVVKENTPA